MKVYLVYITVFGRTELHKVFKNPEAPALYVRDYENEVATFTIEGWDVI